jgi:hypothetical protein
MNGLPLQVTVFPATRSEATLYEDDGLTMQYTKGQFSKRRFTQTRTADADGRDRATTITIAVPEGPYRPQARALVLSVRWTGEPRAVTVSGAPGAAIARLSPDDFERQASGWTSGDDGFVRIKFPDSFNPVSVVIER